MVHALFLTLCLWCPDPGDSLRMETINGKVFIIHQVSEKETLYSISRRYGTPITAILEYNAKASNLEVGQLLQVPYTPKKVQATGGSTHIVAAKETLFSISKQYNVSVEDIKLWNNLKDNNLSQGQELIIRKPGGATETVVAAATTKAGTHTVESKETLFSISKKYNVSVQQIKDWNKIQGNDVKVGQVLIVADPAVAVQQKEETKPVAVVVVPVKEEKKPDVKENTVTVSEGLRGTDEVKEGGLAEQIEGTEGNRKYLALHRTVKPGSIIKVRNELNNREVFVRVVGPLPDITMNENIVVKISKSAYDRLGAIDPKFRVEVTYYK